MQNNWICFDFRKHRVVPTDYTIRSAIWDANDTHPRNWVIEGSNDDISWTIIDEENDCPFLNGKNVVHTFRMNRPNLKEFQYIRMKITGPDWRNSFYLGIDSFEIYGKLI